MRPAQAGITRLVAGLWSLLVSGQTPPEVEQFLRDKAKLTVGEMADVRSGRPIAKVLPSSADIVYVLGVVYVRATPDEYLNLAMDINRLRTLPQYLGVGRLSGEPGPGELRGFELEPDDIRELRRCRPGDCEVQLPVEAIEEFRRAIDWTRADAAVQVNQRVKEMAIEGLRRYRRGGNAQLGAYGDRERSANIAARFQTLLESPVRISEYLPELNRYLLDFPKFSLPNSEPMFYWERVNFGLKPTLRLNHAITYRRRGPSGEVSIFAVKQLYASHYFRVALDLSVCLRDSEAERGFYLVSLRGSSQDGLTGPTGRLLRRAVTDKTRAAQESALAGIKRAIEGTR